MQLRAEALTEYGRGVGERCDEGVRRRSAIHKKASIETDRDV
jgi:hypothetical protein